MSKAEIVIIFERDYLSDNWERERERETLGFGEYFIFHYNSEKVKRIGVLHDLSNHVFISKVLHRYKKGKVKVAFPSFGVLIF